MNHRAAFHDAGPGEITEIGGLVRDGDARLLARSPSGAATA
jgi:hypothetical protein